MTESGCIGILVGVRVLEVDYPLGFVYAFVPTLADSKKHFRYIHLSGHLAERDQEKHLWISTDLRKMKVMLAFSRTFLLMIGYKMNNHCGS